MSIHKFLLLLACVAANAGFAAVSAAQDEPDPHQYEYECQDRCMQNDCSILQDGGRVCDCSNDQAACVASCWGRPAPVPRPCPIWGPDIFLREPTSEAHTQEAALSEAQPVALYDGYSDCMQGCHDANDACSMSCVSDDGTQNWCSSCAKEHRACIKHCKFTEWPTS